MNRELRKDLHLKFENSHTRELAIVLLPKTEMLLKKWMFARMPKELTREKCFPNSELHYYNIDCELS